MCRILSKSDDKWPKYSVVLVYYKQKRQSPINLVNCYRPLTLENSENPLGRGADGGNEEVERT